MKRRDFLKLPAALALAPKDICLDLTGLSSNKWISFTEQLPAEEKMVALYTVFEGNCINICTGKVLSRTEHPDTYRLFGNNVDVLVKLFISYSPDGHFRRSGMGNVDVFVYTSMYQRPREEIMAKIARASWIKKKVTGLDFNYMTAPRHGHKKSKYVGRNQSYWIYINDEIPESLPKLPEPQEPILVQEDGVTYLIKD